MQNNSVRSREEDAMKRNMERYSEVVIPFEVVSSDA